MDRTLHTPLGFDQGDPLVICRTNRDEDIRASFQKLGIKAYYCGWNSAMCGRRHDRVFLDIHALTMSHAEFIVFWRWVCENMMTKLPPGGAEVVFV